MAIRSLKTGSFSRSTQVGNTMIFPGSYESIATVVVPSGGSSSVSFTSIPSNFQHLQVRAVLRDTGTAADWNHVYMTFNGDTATNYSYHFNRAYGATADIYFQAFTTQAYMQIGLLPTSYSGYNSGHASLITDIIDYKDTNKYKTLKTLNGFDGNSATYTYSNYGSGSWRSTAAINSITITAPGRTLAQYSHFALYGVK